MDLPTLTRQQRWALYATLFIIGFAGPSLAAFITPMTHTPDGVSVRATDGPEATVYADRVNLREFQPDPNTLELNTSRGNITLTASGHANADINQINGTWTNTTSLDVSSHGLTIIPEDKHRVTVSGDTSSLNITSMAVDDDKTDFVYRGDSGTTTLTVHGLPADTEIAAVDRNRHDVLAVATTDASGTATFDEMPNSKHAVVLQTNTGGPSIDTASASPSNNQTLSQPSFTASVNVSDPSLPDDNLTAEFSLDGEVVGTTEIGENGTVSQDMTVEEGGGHTWSVTVTDAYGESVSESFNFRSPSQLRIYRETKPETLVDDENLTLTVRFYSLSDGAADDVVTRTVDDGIVDLAGLPVDQRFIVTASANNSSKYVFRRTVVDSLYETSRLYLLQEDEPHSRVVFELDDPTGQFPPEETVFYVEKPIERNGTTRYEAIAGDTFGSTGRFPAILQEDERYRLRVETADGDNERILGAYTVSGSGIEPVQIQQIEPRADADSGNIVYGELGSFNGTPSVTVRFRDLEGDTSEVTYRVVQDGSVVVPNTTSDSDTFAHVYQVASSDASYTIEYWVTSDGATSKGTFTVGDVSGVANRLNIDPQVLSIASWGLILATMGLLAIVDAKLAPLGGTGMASGLVVLGTIAIPSPVLGVAGAISVLSLFGGGGGR